MTQHYDSFSQMKYNIIIVITTAIIINPTSFSIKTEVIDNSTQKNSISSISESNSWNNRLTKIGYYINMTSMK